MLAAGLLAVGVILLSSTFNKIQAAQVAKAKTEQKASDTQAYVSAPTEAIPGTAVKLAQDSSPSLLETIFADTQEEETMPPPVAKELVRYFKVLFRAIISPNAP